MSNLLDKAKMPIGKRAKEKLDEWINENINLPLAKRGMEDTGAALSAMLSASGELLIPENLADAAMSAIPGAKLLKAGKKGMKILKKSNTLNYKDIAAAEKTAADTKRKAFEKVAETLEYKPSGEIIRKKPDLFSDELEKLEKKSRKVSKDD